MAEQNDAGQKYFGAFSATESMTMIIWLSAIVLSLFVSLPLLCIINDEVVTREGLVHMVRYLGFLSIGLSSLQGYLNSFVYSPAGATIFAAGIGLVCTLSQIQVMTCSSWEEAEASLLAALPLLMSLFSTQSVISTYGSVGKFSATWYLILGATAFVSDLFCTLVYRKELEGSSSNYLRGARPDMLGMSFETCKTLFGKYGLLVLVDCLMIPMWPGILDVGFQVVASLAMTTRLERVTLCFSLILKGLLIAALANVKHRRQIYMREKILTAEQNGDRTAA